MEVVVDGKPMVECGGDGNIGWRKPPGSADGRGEVIHRLGRNRNHFDQGDSKTKKAVLLSSTLVRTLPRIHVSLIKKSESTYHGRI